MKGIIDFDIQDFAMYAKDLGFDRVETSNNQYEVGRFRRGRTKETIIIYKKKDGSMSVTDCPSGVFSDYLNSCRKRSNDSWKKAESLLYSNDLRGDLNKMTDVEELRGVIEELIGFFKMDSEVTGVDLPWN